MSDRYVKAKVTSDLTHIHPFFEKDVVGVIDTDALGGAKGTARMTVRGVTIDVTHKQFEALKKGDSK